MAAAKDLYEFLAEAELQHYYNGFHNDLKVNNVGQLKYVEEEDMLDMGMSKPEIRRLKKFFKRECPQGAFGRIKKILTTTADRQFGNKSPPPTTPPTDRSSPGHVKSSKHIIPQDSITLLKVLGQGEFGTVQQGVWTSEEGDQVQVAIKCLSREKMNASVGEFLKEASFMHGIDHENIVQLYGVVLDAEALMLVTELAPLRSLLECLKEPSLRASFPVVLLCDFAAQVADGMSYLENKRLIHRDLAARNILVFAKDKVKISDFGLSRALGVGQDYYKTNFNVNLKLPIAWCAPESINYLKFTSASDVWAYGVTLWEMFSYGFQPWAAFTGKEEGDVNIKDLDTPEVRQKILDAIDEPNYQRLDQPDMCPREHYALMMKCWNHDPQSRPSFGEIMRTLAQVKPEQVQAHRDAVISDRSDYLIYKTSDIITVLDKNPPNVPSLGIWKGVIERSGVAKTGFFEQTDTTPYIEIKTVSPHLHKAKMSRKESGRKSIKSSRKIRADMISRPQNDLRHTGHIGYDGAMFGDVAFIGGNYDKLPVKVSSPYQGRDDETRSTCSLPRGYDGREGFDTTSQSRMSLASSRMSATSSTLGVSTLSATSSQDTLTDVSSMHDGGDTTSWRFRTNGRAPSQSYEDLDDVDLGDFGDFKLPDFSTTLDLDLGPSFMDEMMKALNEASTSETAETTTTTVTSPSVPVSNGSHYDSNPYSDYNDQSPLIDQDTTLTNGQKYDTGVSYLNTSQPSYTPASCIPTKAEEEEFTLDSSMSSHSSQSLKSSASSLKETEKERKSWRPKLKLDDEGNGAKEEDEEEEEDDDEDGEEEEIDEVDGEIIPSMGSKKEKKYKKDGDSIKPMSAEDSLHFEEALARVTQFAEKRAGNLLSPQSDAHDSHSHPESDASETSPKQKSKFSLRKRSPKTEKPTFSDTLERASDFNEDITAEGQEAYNLLVVRGSVKDPDSDSEKSDRQKQLRERRMRRSLEHQMQADKPATNPRNINANIRKPIIPGRTIPDPGSGDSEEVITNPLRRLREAGGLAPRVPPRPQSGDMDSKQASMNGHTGLRDSTRKPNLIPRSEFMSKVKDTESDRSSDGSGDPPGGELDPNHVPLPPRKPLRPVSINTKPRERKYPLDLSNNQKEADNEPKIGSDSESQGEHVDHVTSASSSELNTTRESESSGVVADVMEPVKKPATLPSLIDSTQFCVKNVRCTAQEMGIDDSADPFWSRKVNFEEFVSATGDGMQMQGKYKTVESVSYEDLMEFALDSQEKKRASRISRSSRPRSGENQICDEIRLMRRVLTKDVTVEDCMMALEETNWEVYKAIKYLKLKQLLSVRLGDLETCKDALVIMRWNVQDAANYLMANPVGQESPECINV